MISKFIEKIKIDKRTNCWEWQGSLKDGYGLFSYNGNSYRAHRASWEIYRDTIPFGLHIDHRVCRNKKCVNPNHLVLCTNEENILQPDGAAGLKKNKTHCHKGHKFTKENTYINIRGHRECRECRREFDRKRWKSRTNGNRNMNIVVQCRKCGNDFHPLRGRKSEYCSKECWYKRNS